LETTANIVIRPLEPGLLEDYLVFFDRDAFADNPRWAGCYCYFNHAPHQFEEWGQRTAEQNRAGVSELIQANHMYGYLAYLDGKVAGWCNAGPRGVYTSLDPQPEPPGERVGAIVCFVIAAPYRGRGVARSLLKSALDGFEQQGYTSVEAYPRKDAAGQAANYHGPLQMYLNAGFEALGEQDGQVFVRKRLRQPES